MAMLVLTERVWRGRAPRFSDAVPQASALGPETLLEYGRPGRVPFSLTSTLTMYWPPGPGTYGPLGIGFRARRMRMAGVSD